jgi:hypothetical protein
MIEDPKLLQKLADIEIEKSKNFSVFDSLFTQQTIVSGAGKKDDPKADFRSQAT